MPESATDTAICLARNCADEYKGFVDYIKGLKPSSGNDIRITRDKVDTICRKYKEAKDCRKNSCPMSSAHEDVFKLFGGIDYACTQKDAIVEHGQCIYDATLKDRQAMEEACQADFLHGYLSAAHTIPHHHRFRRDATEDAMRATIARAIGQMKEKLKELPTLTCEELELYKTCVVNRVKDQCDKDGSTEASELADNLYDNLFRNAFKGLKAIQPSLNTPDMNTCLAKKFFFWFW